MWNKIKSILKKAVAPWNKITARRYNVVKLPTISRTQYADCKDRILCATMELVAEFVEEEQKNKIVDWNDKEERTEDGTPVFEKATEIREWWRAQRPEKIKMLQKMNKIADRHTKSTIVVTKIDKNGDETIKYVDTIKYQSLEEAKKSMTTEEKNILEKEFKDQNAILNRMKCLREIAEYEAEIKRKDQKALEEAIKIRPWLWI